jgi:hypothetical protein
MSVHCGARLGSDASKAANALRAEMQKSAVTNLLESAPAAISGMTAGFAGPDRRGFRRHAG